MKLNTLDDYLLSELKDLYNAESQLIRGLPKMSKAASSPRLRQAFDEHLEVTKKHKQRLEQVFEQIGHTPRGKKCHAMEGLLEEAQEMIDASGDEAVHDAALIGAAQRIEHYEIAAYGTARTIARRLGHDQAAQLLQTTLDEEEQTDRELTEIAESEVNVHAQRNTADDDEREE